MSVKITLLSNHGILEHIRVFNDGKSWQSMSDGSVLVLADKDITIAKFMPNTVESVEFV